MTFVNLPGCPAHPDWIVGTLVQILGGVMPTLDSYSRPTTYYTSATIHSRCPRSSVVHVNRGSGGWYWHWPDRSAAWRPGALAQDQQQGRRQLSNHYTHLLELLATR